MFGYSNFGFFPAGMDTSAIGEMHLLPEPLFSIPTDNVHILNVTGSKSGRIFMAGKDGSLYELYYQVTGLLVRIILLIP